jgi:hypothetical protein|tara:strand:- start:787 stop:1035 length:249 start_codon:yes stop_codon:yes gene_type:complete
MSGKRSKKLRRKAKDLLIEWIRTMVPDGEDPNRINRQNLDEFLPTQTHIFAGGQFRMSAYTLKWFYKKVKRNPDVTLENINA